jgi:hypothetical protein
MNYISAFTHISSDCKLSFDLILNTSVSTNLNSSLRPCAIPILAMPLLLVPSLSPQSELVTIIKLNYD